jgi:hypothetical protein
MMNRFPFILLLISLGFLAMLSFNDINYSSSAALKQTPILPDVNAFQFAINNEEPLTFSNVQTGVDISQTTSIFSVWFGDNGQNNINFVLKGKLQEGEYYLDEPMIQFASLKFASEEGQFSTDQFYSGKLTIVDYNPLTGSLSGSFSFNASPPTSKQVISVKAGVFNLVAREDSL